MKKCHFERYLWNFWFGSFTLLLSSQAAMEEEEEVWDDEFERDSNQS